MPTTAQYALLMPTTAQYAGPYALLMQRVPTPKKKLVEQKAFCLVNREYNGRQSLLV